MKRQPLKIGTELLKKWDMSKMLYLKSWDSRLTSKVGTVPLKTLTVQPSPAQAIIVGVPVGVFLWQSASYTPVVVVLWYVCPFA